MYGWLVSRPRFFPLRAVICLIILVVICLAPCLSHAGSDLAREQWMNGYEKLEQAREAEDAGRTELAASLYGSALEVFSNVKATYPDWNPSLLRYRIRFCRERIDALRKTIDTSVRTLSKNDLLEIRDKQRAQIDELQAALRKKENELEITSRAMERARREAARNAAARDETEGLMREKQVLSERIKLYEKKIERLETEAAEARQGSQASRRAARLEDRLKVTEAEKKKMAADLAEVREDRDELQIKLTAMGTERETLRSENLQIKAALDSNRARISEMDQAMANLNRQVAGQKEALSLALQQKSAAERRLTETKEAAAELRQTVAKLEQQISEIQTSRTEAENRAAMQPEQVTAMTQLLKDKEVLLIETRAKLEKAVSDAEAIDQQWVRMKALAESQGQASARLSGRVRELEAEQAKKNAALAELRAKLDQATSGREDMSARLDHYRNRLAEVESERDIVTRQADSRLGLVRQQEEEIRGLTAKIADLQEINENLRKGDSDGRASSDVSELKKQFANLLTEKEYHRQNAEQSQREVQRLSQQLATLQSDLSTRTKDESVGMSRLRTQLAAARDAIEREKRRADALEAVVAGPAKSDAETSRSGAITALLHKGVDAEKEGNSEVAVWYYKQVIEQDANNAIALRRLGILAIQAGNDDEAIGHLSKAFYADPDDRETLQQLGFALVRQEKPDMALSMLSRAAALNKDDPQVHKQLGVACSSLGWQQAAEVQFRRALQLDDNDAEAAFNLAVLLASMDESRVDEARKWYKVAREGGAQADPGLDKFFGYKE